MYHLKLIKGLSYTGIVKATQKKPDVFVEDKAIADAAIATGYFKLLKNKETPAQEAPVQTAHLDTAQLEEMKVDDLKKLAADMGIDTTGFKRKADYVEAISAVEVTPGPETDGEDENEVDYGEGSPTMIDLQEQQ